MQKYFSAVLLVGIFLSDIGLLAAQDISITITDGASPIFIESTNDEVVSYRAFDDEQALIRNVNLQQAGTLQYQDQQSNSSYLASLEEHYEESSDTSRLFIVTTTDGNTYVGKILSQEGATVQVETQTLGVINIPKENIKKITMVSSASSLRDGELWEPNSFASRYFITPSGYGLAAGEGYYQNNWIFFNQLNVGITDHVSIGLGAVPLFLFGGAPTPVWLNPKVSVPISKDKFNIGGSALVGTVLGGGTDGGGFGFLIGTATLGDKNRNASFGLGYGYANGNFAQTPVITFSGTYRVGQKGYLVTDNFFVSTAGFTSGIIMIGGRTVWPSITLDYGGLIPFGDVGSLIVFPWLGVSVPFGS